MLTRSRSCKSSLYFVLQGLERHRRAAVPKLCFVIPGLSRDPAQTLRGARSHLLSGSATRRFFFWVPARASRGRDDSDGCFRSFLLLRRLMPTGIEGTDPPSQAPRHHLHFRAYAGLRVGVFTFEPQGLIAVICIQQRRAANDVFAAIV